MSLASFSSILFLRDSLKSKHVKNVLFGALEVLYKQKEVCIDIPASTVNSTEYQLVANEIQDYNIKMVLEPISSVTTRLILIPQYE